MLLGNSRIKPWDYLYIIDSYNDMTGVVEVEQIVEKLSFETGYICEIKPNCVVFANEVSSMPILEGLKAIVGGTYYEHSQLISNFKGNDFFNYLTTNNLVSTAIDKLDYLYDGSILNGQSIQDISSAIQFDTATTTDLIYTGGSQDSIQSTFMSGAWLLGSLFYLNKVSAGQSIIIYPLFKNGLPYTAGIPKARPEAIWTIFRGQVSAFINDLTKGTSSYIDYWKLLGIESLKAWSYDSTLNKNKAEAGDRVK